MKILLIEDEVELRRSICRFLSDQGYLVETAGDFHAANDKSATYDYACVLADIGLPGGSGLDIIRTLKANKSKAGIIILSAKDSLDDKVHGLELGADDYLAKPFHLAELNARIKALIRRKNFDGDANIRVNEIEISPEQRRVMVNDQVVELTTAEYNLLLYLVSNRNHVVSKSSVAEHLWGDHADRMDSYDFIYTHIKNLRKKLMEKGGQDYIKSIYGMGYVFNTDHATTY